ncbi:MAG: glycosyltransferase, partial [Chlamydiae bacterium]|nr:glycosyltransferase [Chlamydiota bacterium]
LNMIVKNERAVIKRCLNSIKPFIDYWVIVDTGSTDGTQEIIRSCLTDIPGELHEKPWINFGYNRQEALDLAKGKGDYLLLIDADEELKCFDPIPSAFAFKTSLSQDYYFAVFHERGETLESTRAILINNHIPWKWEGVLHEQLVCLEAKTFQTLQNIYYLRDTPSSARSQDPQKYRKDAKLLEEALQKEPNNSRYVFYLAQSYCNAKDYPSALQNYQKRARLGGNPEEVFWSLFGIGRLQEALTGSFDQVLQSYNQAFEYRPWRAEPLYYMSKYLLQKKLFAPAYTLATAAMSLPPPTDPGYMELFVYEYGALSLAAFAAYQLHRDQEAKHLFQTLLLQKNLPKEILEKAQEHLKTLSSPS